MALAPKHWRSRRSPISRYGAQLCWGTDKADRPKALPRNHASGKAESVLKQGLDRSCERDCDEGPRPGITITDKSFQQIMAAITAHTTPNVPTSGGRRGTVSPTSAADMQGTRLRCRTCSIDAGIRKPKRSLYGATNHRAGIECVGLTARRLFCLRPHDRERWYLRRGLRGA